MFKINIQLEIRPTYFPIYTSSTLSFNFIYVLYKLSLYTKPYISSDYTQVPYTFSETSCIYINNKNVYIKLSAQGEFLE